MAFNPQGQSGDESAPLAEINIIPLVDVMLVLLIITMVTAPFMEQGINVDLPVTKQGQGLEKGTKNEEPIFLYISKAEGLMLGKNKIKKEDLASSLNSVFAARRDRELFVKADKSIPYGEVADIMTRVQAAGISKVGLVTLPE